MRGYDDHLGQIISKFGGQNALARALGRRQSTVWGWVSRGQVPNRRIPEVIAAAAQLDPPVYLRPDDFFDLTPRSEERAA